MSDDDGIKVAELETQFAEMDGYTAESRAGELLIGVGSPWDSPGKSTGVGATANP